jgi:transcriptional regulator with XRE-family HTH domain
MAVRTRQIQWGALDQLMKDAGVSVVDLARHVGVSRVTVYGWLHGRQRPSHERLRVIATKLAKTPEAIPQVAGQLLS